MYCWKCFKKIEGDGETYYNASRDRVEWYHPECFTRDEPLTDEERVVAKTAAQVIKIIGKTFIGNEVEK